MIFGKDVYKRQDGQTDEEIRELVPEAKPSLMDRLKADKPEHEARQKMCIRDRNFMN